MVLSQIPAGIDDIFRVLTRACHLGSHLANSPIAILSHFRIMKQTLRNFTCFLLLVGFSPALNATESAQNEGSASYAGPESDKAPSTESRNLFNGKDLEGWDGDPSMWKVVDGVIRGETTASNPAKGNTFLILQGGTLKDFELQLSFRCTADNNSGVQYRSKHIVDKSAKNKWVLRGYQHELRNESKFPNVSGFIYDEGGKRGRICLVGEKAVWVDGAKKVESTLIDQAAYEKLFKVNEWNDVKIVANGNTIQHYMNGSLVLEFTDSPDNALVEGVIGLQLHAGKPMWAEFKNITLREIK